MSQLQTLIETGWEGGYQLIDLGHGRKLESVGPYRIVRPEEQAMAPCTQMDEAWTAADAVFTGRDDEEQGRWKFANPALNGEAPFTIELEDVRFHARFTNFRHLGFFPEQRAHWQWLREQLAQRAAPRMLNLFAYTGVASLIGLRAGAQLVHLDASKKANGWFRDNLALSGLEKAPVRLFTDDARAFVAREIRRENRYDLIVLDPPKFGRGPEGEIWNLFTDLPALLKDCAALLAPGGAMLLSVYAIRASSIAFAELCRSIFSSRLADLQSGELVLSDPAGRLFLSTSHFVRLRVAA